MQSSPKVWSQKAFLRPKVLRISGNFSFLWNGIVRNLLVIQNHHAQI